MCCLRGGRDSERERERERFGEREREREILRERERERDSERERERFGEREREREIRRERERERDSERERERERWDWERREKWGKSGQLSGHILALLLCKWGVIELKEELKICIDPKEDNQRDTEEAEG